MSVDLQFKYGMWKTCGCPGSKGAVTVPSGTSEITTTAAIPMTVAAPSGASYLLLPNIIAVDVPASDAAWLVSEKKARYTTAAERAAGMKGRFSRSMSGRPPQAPGARPAAGAQSSPEGQTPLVIKRSI